MMHGLIIFLLLFPAWTVGQESGGLNLIKTFKGSELGYSYPMLTLGKAYHKVESNYNLGVKGSMIIGREYDSGISLMVAPTLFYSSIGKTVHQSNYHVNPKTRTVDYQNFSLSLPGLIEIPVLVRIRISAGVYLALPLISTGMLNNFEFEESIIPHFNKDIFNRRDVSQVRLGFLNRISIPIKVKENITHFINLEYMHFLTYNYQTGTDEKWFTLSYVKKMFTIREKREKWDRALLKRN